MQSRVHNRTPYQFLIISFGFGYGHHGGSGGRLRTFCVSWFKAADGPGSERERWFLVRVRLKNSARKPGHDTGQCPAAVRVSAAVRR